MLTLHDMRSMLECIQSVWLTAMQSAVNANTIGVLIALLTGIAIKLPWFRPKP